MKKIFKGMIVGISCLLPGVCSGLVAMTLNVYEELLEVGSKLFKIKVLFKHLLLLLGMLIGLLLTVFLLSSLNEHYPFLVSAAFIGFSLSSFIIFIKEEEVKKKIRYRSFLIILGIIIIVVFDLLTFLIDKNHGLENYNFVLVIVGALLSAFAFIAPGISGSLLLVILGLYFPLFKIVKKLISLNFNLTFSQYAFIVIFTITFLMGIIISSKILKYLIKNYHNQFYDISLGMIIGSIVVLIKNAYQDLIVSQIGWFMIVLLISFILFVNIAKEKYG